MGIRWTIVHGDFNCDGEGGMDQHHEDPCCFSRASRIQHPPAELSLSWREGVVPLAISAIPVDCTPLVEGIHATAGHTIYNRTDCVTPWSTWYRHPLFCHLPFHTIFLILILLLDKVFPVLVAYIQLQSPHVHYVSFNLDEGPEVYPNPWPPAQLSCISMATRYQIFIPEFMTCTC